MKHYIILFMLFLFSSSAFAECGRSLGSFSLRISPAAFEPRLNEMPIGAPLAESVYADFSYSPRSTELLNFSPGSGGSFNCETRGIEYSFEISQFTEEGVYVKKETFEGYPRGLRFESGMKYQIRAILANFPEPCSSISHSFLSVKN